MNIGLSLRQTFYRIVNAVSFLYCNESRIYIFLCVFTCFVHYQGKANDAIVREYHTRVVTDGKILAHQTNLVLQINNSKGIRHAEFSIPYSKLIELKSLSANLTDIYGNMIRKLTKSEIVTSSAYHTATFYNDNFVKRFQMIHNKFPYIIELKTEYKINSFLQITQWSPIWNEDISTLKSSLTFAYPAGYLFREQSNIIDPPVQTTQKDLMVLTWNSSYTAAPKRNALMPPISSQTPMVHIVPINFQYIKPGSFSSWRSYGNWQISIAKKLNELPTSEIETIDRITQGISDTLEIVRILYHYLQDNFRYVNVDIKYGGMLPYSAAYVSTNRFGDCKALANFMKTMLSHKNITSHVADIRSESVISPFNHDFPAQVFNHVIVCVPVKNDTIWLECTSNVFPAGYFGTQLQNRYALLVIPDNSKLVALPRLRGDEVSNEYSYQFIPHRDNEVLVNSAFKLRGYSFEMLGSFDKHASRHDKEKFIEHFIPYRNPKINEWKIVSPHRDSSYMILFAKYIVGSPILSVGDYIKIEHPNLQIPNFEKESDRFYPVQINYPLIYTDTLVYQQILPETVPDNDSIHSTTNQFGACVVHRKIRSGSLIVVRQINIPEQIIQLNDYKDFYKFYQRILTEAGSSIVKK